MAVGGMGVMVEVGTTVLVSAGTVFEGSNTDSGEMTVCDGAQAAIEKVVSKTTAERSLFIVTCLC
jgi:hypothetical protein